MLNKNALLIINRTTGSMRYSSNIFDILSSMKVKPSEPSSHLNEYILSSKPLGFFKKPSQLKTDEFFWDTLENEYFLAIRKTAPKNAFQEMIQWTNEGKLWSFPIDNEKGLEEEAAVPFHKHVFFNDQMADLPEKGPVRDFMNMVALGLSKNYALSVDRKKETFNWFKKYFEEHEAILGRIDVQEKK